MASHHTEYHLHRLESPTLQMFIILLGAFMAILDTSVVQVAIPTMEAELSASTDQIQWVLTGYLLVLGVLVPLSGWLTDRFGAKRLFIFSIATFTLGSALCGMAWNLPSIIIFRVIQGLGGGFMMPVAMSMIYLIFPPERRGAAMGVFGIVIMVAPALGPLLSGWLVQEASWRLIFYINVPVGVVATILAVTRLYDFPHQVRAGLDIGGVIFTVTGFFSLLYGFSNVAQYGWHDWRVEPFVIAGVVLLAILVWYELRQEHPLIQLRVFREYMYSMSLVISSLVYVSMFVGVFLMPLFLQNIMGYNALQTGEFLTPAALVSAVMMLISGRLFDRVGARPLGVVGLGVLALTTFGYTHLDLNSSAAFIQTLYIARSIGMGLTMMPVTTAGMNTVPPQLISQGSALSNTVRQSAASLGTAILTNYLSQMQTLHAQHLAERLSLFSPQGVQYQALVSRLAHEGMSLAQAQTQAGLLMYQTIQDRAFVSALDNTFWISTLMAIAAWVLNLFFASAKEEAIRRGRRHGAGQQQAVVEM
ncbi:MAG: DHA2 family efflux MFS transporter permease subunit [Firmicutes bacterium]|nr:DHA2 family efflux MFS transporter permease subunit [Alicyclobacillaceae bacterium]MCL6497056.1 DHA2 family efflux MFS transporter permease subunit [Bacillota bacterium]